MKTASGRKFLWGVSTSTYQHEGGFNGEGEPLNNWGEWERSGRVERTGRAVDFWNRYEEDFSLSAGLGLTSFRLGIDWTRIQPGPEKIYAPEALRHYAGMLGAARRKGLEPLLTFFHFAHPAWLGLDPWLEEKTLELFVDYSLHSLEFINEALIGEGLEPLRWLITINEPNMLAVNSYLTGFFPSGQGKGYGKALAAYRNMVRAHVLLYRGAHELYARKGWGRPLITFNNYASDLYWLDKLFIDLLTLPRRGVKRREVPGYLEAQAQRFERDLEAARLPLRKSLPFWAGNLMKWWLFRKGRKIFEEEHLNVLLDLIYEKPEETALDFVAIDYYDPFIGNIFRFPRFEEFGLPAQTLRGWLINSVTSKQWDWPALPQGLSFFVRLYEKEFPDLPVIIAENGMARLRPLRKEKSWRQDQLKRAVYLERHLGEVLKMLGEGSRLEGYFHWSLTDNYEWGSYAARFGLYHIDLHTEELERKAGVAAGVYADFIRAAEEGRRGPALAEDSGI